MAVNRTIVLKGNAKGHHDEGVLATVATPGMHVQLGSNGQYSLSPATSAEMVKSEVIIVKEDPYEGRGLSDQYAIGDIAFLYHPLPGDHIHLLVKSGQDIAVADKLVPEGGGTGLWIEAAGTETTYRFRALESTGGALGANQLVACEMIR